MKNILVYFASHEVNQSVLITDISLLLDSNREMKEAKDAITWMLNPVGNSAEFNSLICDRTDGIFDTRGYALMNLLYDVFGYTTPPFTVEYEVYVRCDI